MKQYILIYDIVRVGEGQYKAHYRAYDENKNLFSEEDYIYNMRTIRDMSPGYLKNMIVKSIHHRLSECLKLIDYKTSFRSTCLVSNTVLKQQMADKKHEESVKKETVMSVVKDDNNPRIYRVVLINGNYTIVKAETQYLTREQAKEELFRRQLEDA